MARKYNFPVKICKKKYLKQFPSYYIYLLNSCLLAFLILTPLSIYFLILAPLSIYFIIFLFLFYVLCFNTFVPGLNFQIGADFSPRLQLQKKLINLKCQNTLLLLLLLLSIPAYTLCPFNICIPSFASHSSNPYNTFYSYCPFHPFRPCHPFIHPIPCMHSIHFVHLILYIPFVLYI